MRIILWFTTKHVALLLHSHSESYTEDLKKFALQAGPKF